MSAERAGRGVSGEAIQQSEGGKWHRVWWGSALEGAGIFLTHVGIYQPERHPRKPVAKVAREDLCRTCFKVPSERGDQ